LEVIAVEDADKKLLELVHQSGFPFQIGVRKEIERTAGEHGWSVSAEEYHWIHPTSGKSGFIDLIAEHSQLYYSLVLECKRVRAKDRSAKGPSWIFLTPRDYTTSENRLSGYKADKIRDDVAERKLNHDKAYWTDTEKFSPGTIESAYCVFETQDEKSPMLERIADTLLPSVEAAATDWFSHSWVSNGESRVFIPVIVTNATLYTCSFDAGDISMVDGNLPDGEFQGAVHPLPQGAGPRERRVGRPPFQGRQSSAAANHADHQRRRAFGHAQATHSSVSRGFGRQEGRRPVRLSRLQAPATRRMSLISRKRWRGSVGEGTKPKCS
jgi:hypothetical protein